MLKHLLRACVVLLCVSPLSAQTLTQDRTSASQPAMADTSLLDLYEFALSITPHAGTDYERAEHLLNWLSHNFRWLSTDYKKRTVKEIIARRGGNCFELAMVYMSLIKTLGIRYRQVAEINIHPRSERRQRNAEALVAKKGPAGSVFGEEHNDHRWVEIFDGSSKDWIPADPSVGVIGLQPWLKSRVWFGKRWAVDTSITNAMIVPIAIFATDSAGRVTENRTSHYVVESFNRLYGGKLSALPSWESWRQGVERIGERCRGAFEGRVNLHDFGQELSALAATYKRLRLEFCGRWR